MNLDNDSDFEFVDANESDHFDPETLHTVTPKVHVRPVPESVRSELLTLGDYLHNLRPMAYASAYLVDRASQPELLGHFGSCVEGNLMLCVRVRDECLYDEALADWNRLDFCNWNSRDLLRQVTIALFNNDHEKPCIRLHSVAVEPLLADAFENNWVNVVLIGPARVVLFKFPIVGDDYEGFGIQLTGSVNYNPYRIWSDEELETARESALAHDFAFEFEPTYVFSLEEYKFQLRRGAVVYVGDSEEFPLMTDMTRPLSVTAMGRISALVPEEPPISFDDCLYVASTVSRHELPVARQDDLPENVLFVSCRTTLAPFVHRGFVGYLAYKNEPFFGARAVLRVANHFDITCATSDNLIISAIEGGNLPIVFADQEGNSFLVRYPMNDDWANTLLDIELSR